MFHQPRRGAMRALLVAAALAAPFAAIAAHADEPTQPLADAFANPPESATPGVYWFFMDGNLSKEGMRADLDAMRAAGIGRALTLEADQGGPRGNVNYMTPEWLDCWNDAGKYAEKLGIELVANVGPGWCGAGGPWIDPDHSMQHLRSSETRVHGGARVEAALPVPTPRDPYFGRGSLGPCADDWANYYRDVAVVAYPAPKVDKRLENWEEKALFYRPPFSSTPGVKPYLVPLTDDADAAMYSDSIVPADAVIDITDKLGDDGILRWDAPEGDWIVMRLGRRLTGQTTRPAPSAGLGLESDKFEPTGIERHFAAFDDVILATTKFSTLHHDSWEMSSQNWSEHFRELFMQSRGYDPLLWTPAMFGVVLDSVEATERFLWDLREVAADLILKNNVLRMKELAAERGAEFSTETYDLNPAGDLRLFSAADLPMCEFWSNGYGFDSRFSVFEAVSSANTTGRPIVGAESFTTHLDQWRQHPGVAKNQGDWAFCAGVNRFFFHRMCSQPNDDAPGLSLGPHGMHFDRTETWFPLLGGKNGYIEYITRVQSVLQHGTTSADVLFVDQEKAPSVFLPPPTAMTKNQDKDRWNFNGCLPQVLIDRAVAADGKVSFPQGASYSVVVLPQSREMTVELAEKLLEIKNAGVPIIGMKPVRTPGLKDREANDKRLQELADQIWAGENAAVPAEYPDFYNANENMKLLSDAKWIWSGEWQSVAVGVELSFAATFDAADASADAFVVVAADNDATVKLNGKVVGKGGDFRTPERFSLTGALKAGKNTLEISVYNGGEQPTPAGLIAMLSVDGVSVPTDGSWTAADMEGNPLPTTEIGPFDMAPWNMRYEKSFKRDSSYPDWSVVAKKLNELNVAPDFISFDALEKNHGAESVSRDSVRWIHKIVGDLDVYFLGNAIDSRPTDSAGIVANCFFRVTGKSAQLWDPATGKRYALDSARPARRSDNGQAGRSDDNPVFTCATIPFGPNQSWFVVFTPDKAETDALPPASLLFAPVEETAALDLSEDWDATVDQNASSNRDFAKGKAKTVHFDTLVNLKDSDDEYLRYYSGLIDYKKTFDADAALLDANAGALLLDLDYVAVMAKVTLNGQELATLWGQPWRVGIPEGLLKPTGNVLEIKVANLWCNRLIGDASLPAEERFTRTSNPMWGPGDEQLQDSGIVGKVRIIREKKIGG